jgi:hypothetical protein
MRGNWCVSEGSGVAALTVRVLPCVVPMVGMSYTFCGYVCPEEPLLLHGRTN